jgi:flagellar biosynthesis/type III secretory pathway M-ring protein FliF/YscJ
VNLLYITIAVLAAFLAIWVFVVVPAERRHHERKLEALQKRIEKRQASQTEEQVASEPEPASGNSGTDVSHGRVEDDEIS